MLKRLQFEAGEIVHEVRHMHYMQPFLSILVQSLTMRIVP